MEPDSKTEDSSSDALADLPGDELLGLWKRGNERAAAILVDRYCLRLVALVATRMNRRFRDIIDPDDVVQSAMGSFFTAARQSKIQISQSASLWRLLATFAKRKMLRSIERHSAEKRGGRFQRVGFDEIAQTQAGTLLQPPEADELYQEIQGQLPVELRAIFEGLMAGKSQQEMAEDQELNERTIRRRVAELRKVFSPERESISASAQSFQSMELPRIHYREFVLGKLIGSGGFGKVYRATMQSDAKVVAVKFLRKCFWQSLDAQQSFLREIDQASRIEHPMVVRYLGWGQSPHGGPYVVTQWIDGKTLADCRGVSAARFRGYLIDICKALQVIHDSSIVHGDLSASNLLVTDDDKIVIADFGFSQNLNDHREASQLGGTLGFAAPEQVAPAFGSISDKTDIYALGGLAYWYLTGQPPHQRGSTEESLASTIAVSEVDIDFASSDSAERNVFVAVARACLKAPVRQRPEISDVIELLENQS